MDSCLLYEKQRDEVWINVLRGKIREVENRRMSVDLPRRT